MILLLLRSNLFGHAVQIWSHLSRGWGSRQNVEKWTVKIRDNNKTVADATLRTLNNYNKTYMRLKGTLRWIKWCVSNNYNKKFFKGGKFKKARMQITIQLNSVQWHQQRAIPLRDMETVRTNICHRRKHCKRHSFSARKKKHIISDTSITAYICILHYVLYYSMYSYITNTK